MRRFMGSVAFALLLATTTLPQPPTQTQTSSTQGSGSISGRVTVTGKPARNVPVMLLSSDKDRQRLAALVFEGNVAARTLTDEDGRYQFAGLTPGDYSVSTFAPATVAPDEPAHGSPLGLGGKPVALSEGQSVDGIDFDLRRGGVITGRVTDLHGKPVIAVSIQLNRVDEKEGDKKGQEQPVLTVSDAGTGALSIHALNQVSTDDRGIYRAYGLEPGRYTVAVSRGSGIMEILSGGGGSIGTTYHPGVTDASRATPVEVKAGAEAINIDIRVGLPAKTFRASGRVIEAETGKPVSNAIVLCSRARETVADPAEPDEPEDSTGFALALDTGFAISAMTMPSPTDARGEFRLEGLAPGAYKAFIMSMPGQQSGGDRYSEMAVFEVKGLDISGLEIRMRRGASITGDVSVEGAADAGLADRLTKLRISAYVAPADKNTAPGQGSSGVAADGTFRMRGLPPGKVYFGINSPPDPADSSSDQHEPGILRVERNGLLLPQGVEVNPGESMSGVRIVLGYAKAVLRGQVKVEGGSLQQGVALFVTARRTGAQAFASENWGEVDVNGRFEIKGLLPGEYEVSLGASSRGAPPKIPNVTQTVAVTLDSTAEITMVLDLKAKDK